MKISGATKFLFLIANIISASPSWAIDARKITSGVYDGLIIAVDKIGIINGYYKDSQAGRVCNFFISGKNSSSAIPINSWDMEEFPGTMNADGERIKLKVSKTHPGCHVVGNPDIFENGAMLEKTFAAQWATLKIIKINRAPIFSGSSEDKKTKSYFIKDDVLGVLATDEKWVQVELYRPGKSTIKGWIRSSDARDPASPK